MARMEVWRACSVAVSKDGRWIAAGTLNGDAIVWDAKTFGMVFSHKQDEDIFGVDFSPDSTRLVTASKNRTATVWDVAARKQVLSLDHEGYVLAAKYSPQGDRIATATYRGSVRLWDSNDGRFLVDIPVEVTPWYNSGLFWSNNHHLFAVSHSAIKEFEASIGSAITEWPVPETNGVLCIALPRCGDFLAYATHDTITFWVTSTHSQIGHVQHPQNIVLLVSSPDDQFLADIGCDGRITVRSLSRIIVSIVFFWIRRISIAPSFCSALQDSIPVSRLHPTFQEPFIQIDDAALHSWKHDQLENADALLTAAISESPNPNHQVFTSRALVRARLRQWDAALVDADQVHIALFPQSLTLTSIYPRPSKLGRLSLVTSQKV